MANNYSNINQNNDIEKVLYCMASVLNDEGDICLLADTRAAAKVQSRFTAVMPEYIIRQELSDLNYGTSSSLAAEIDFVIQKEGRAIPIEVKAEKFVLLGIVTIS